MEDIEILIVSHKLSLIQECFNYSIFIFLFDDLQVPIIELPEDPDFSILKKSIPSSISEAGDIAKLLVDGTEEVCFFFNYQRYIYIIIYLHLFPVFKGVINTKKGLESGLLK